MQELLGSGVTVSNVSYIGNTGQSSGTAHSDDNGYYEWDYPVHQIGSFTGGAGSNLGLNEGLILSSGHVGDAGKPADFFANSYVTSFPMPEADLEQLSSGNTHNISVLEFDFVPDGPTISFEYVFASEELPNFVGQQYNDVFGFFLSGPGINGPYTNNAVNIALIPGTSTPITINNVNNGYGDCQPTFGSGGGNPPTGPCTNCEYYVDNCGGSSVAYGGFTTVLKAEYPVECGETYHIKLAVGDVGDYAWDSAIFLKKNSLSSTDITISLDNESICAGESVTLTAELSDEIGEGGTYSWDNNNENTEFITVSPSETTEYTVSYTLGACVISASAIVNVEDCDGCVPPTFSTENITVCEAGSVDLNDGVTVSNGIVTFYASEEDANNTSNPILSAVENSGTYYVRVDDEEEDDCYSIQTIEVIISDVNFTEDFGHPTCAGDDGFITITASGGTEPYSYSINNGTTSQNDGNFNGLGVGNYEILIIDANGCEATGEISLINAEGPNLDSSTPVNPSCEGECDGGISVVVSGGETPYTYVWKDENGDVVGGNSAEIDDLCVGAYTLTVTDANGCNLSQTFTLTEPSASDAAFDFDDFCEGDSNGPTNLGTPGGTFSFATDLGDGATINPQTGVISNGVGGTTYTVVYETGGDCSVSHSEEVTVFESPVASFTAEPMVGVPPLDVVFENNSQGAANNEWDFLGNGGYITDNNPTLGYTYTEEGEYDVTLLVTSANGCTNSTSQTITVILPGMNYEFPNVFSPNEDGQNDNFKLISYENIAKLEIVILNRWGNVVYEDDTPDFKWNGKVKNVGAECTDGVYFYRAVVTSFDGGEITEHGYIHLIR